jgi:hypothetical protein
MPPVRPAIKAAGFLAFLAVLAAFYFSNTPLNLFLTRLQQLGATVAILWSAGGFGIQIVRWITGPESRLSILETFVYAEVLGLGLLSSFMILFGVFHAWTPLGAWVLVLLGILCSKPFLRSIRQLAITATFITTIPAEGVGPSLAMGVGCFSSLLLALAPVTYYDSLVYHLALPATYIRAQHWVPYQELIYSAFPQTLEMLWTLGLLIFDETVTSLIGWSLGVFLLLAVIAAGWRFLSASVGWVAAGLLALMPAFILLNAGAYVDVGLTLFSFMAFYTVFLWKEQPSLRWLVCAGLLMGWALGTKYTAALPAFLLGVLILSQYKGVRKQKTLQGFGIYCAAALLVFAPWLIKNLIYVGNPVFPFFYNLGIQQLNPWLNQAAEGYFAGITEYGSRSLLQLPRAVWEAATNGSTFGRGADVLGAFGWAPLLGLIPALGLSKKWPVFIKLSFAFVGLYVVLWGINRPVLRFLLPAAPVCALLAAYAWVHGIRPQHALIRWASRGIVASLLLSGLALLTEAMDILSPLASAVGIESREDYLLRKLDYYGAAYFINTQTPADSHVYVFGDQRGYYYNRTLSLSPVFSKNPVIEWANAGENADFIRERLKEKGVTHLVFNQQEFERLQSYPFIRFNERGEKTWDALQSQLNMLYHTQSCAVYSL